MKIFGKILLVFLGLVVVVILVSLASNFGLPTESKIVDHLSDDSKAQLKEFEQITKTIGASVWPGFGDENIPVILYNESYAFLVNYPGEPADGWEKVPSGEHRGTSWEVVQGDTFDGQPYYRQRLTDPDKTPENFTVLVGDRWVASLQTEEFAAIEFYSGFQEEVPGFLRMIFPYRLFWKMLIPNAETYVTTLVHESFHAYQGISVPERLAAAEKVVAEEANYPWENEDVEQAWKDELDALSQAVIAEDLTEKTNLVRNFLVLREERRKNFSFSDDQRMYEKQREWLEGLAKYVELETLNAAADATGYQPSDAIKQVRGFDGYERVYKYYDRQIAQVPEMASQGETRFYYTGFCIGLLLDELSPGWKDQAFSPGVFLEDLLAQAVQ